MAGNKSHAPPGNNLPETNNVIKASKKVINGSNSKDWKKIAEDVKKNIK